MTAQDGTRCSLMLPPGSCDCHIHVLDASPRATTVPISSNFSWDDYSRESKAAGIDRVVIVQPSFYGFNNEFLVRSLKVLGARARGVAVVPQNVSERSLIELHEAGVRGVRFNLVSGGLGLQSLGMVADRIRPYGWHIQIFVDSESLLDLMPSFMGLGVNCVFDHMANVNRCQSTEHPGFKALLHGMDSGRIWVKLSSALAPLDLERARLIIQRNSQRVVWGSDWPHVIYKGVPGSIGTLAENVININKDPEITRKIFVDNPSDLYFS